MSTDNKQRLALIGLAIFVMLLMWAASAIFGSARAHDDWAWVRQDKFRTPTGGHCCSEAHCRPQEAGEVIRIPGGYRHVPTGGEIFTSKPGVYATEDPDLRPFVCLIDGVFVCTFENGHET